MCVIATDRCEYECIQSRFGFIVAFYISVVQYKFQLLLCDNKTWIQRKENIFDQNTLLKTRKNLPDRVGLVIAELIFSSLYQQG